MPIYEYTAIDARGKSTKGTTDAENTRAARQKLRALGIFPTDLRENSEAVVKKSRDIKKYLQVDRVGLRDVAISTRQLATLVTAGLPLVAALQALADQTESAALRRMVVSIRENVEEGESLARSLARFPKAFSKLYVNMVTSGEASGTLDKVLQNLADYLEGQIELRRKVTSALVYPILMLFVCGAVVSALLVFVVPKIVDIFKKQGTALPLPTKIVIGFSDFLLGYWWLVIGSAVAAVALGRLYYQRPTGRMRIDRMLLRFPIYGRLYTKVCTARVSRTLGTLMSSGVGVLDGIDIAKNIVSNVHVTKALEEARDGVREGRSLARELGKSGIFPPMLGHMVAVGEKSGELEDMLVKAGRAYEQDVNAALGSLTQIIEPMLMIIVGVLVLGIVVSMLLPMTDLIGALQQH